MASGSKHISSTNIAVSLEEQLANCIRENNEEGVQNLLQAGVDVNIASLSGKTPLSLAAHLGNINVMKVLTQYTNQNNNTNSKDNNNISKTKTIKSNISTTQYSSNNLGYYIVIHKDDDDDENNCDKKTNNGSETQTPDDMDKLEWDCELNETNDNNNKIEQQDIIKSDSISKEEQIWSSQYKWYAQILDKTCSAIMMENIFKPPKHVCDLDLQDSNGLTALHYAADMGHTDVVKFLIDAGCRIDLGEIENLTALHIAAARGRTEIVAALIQGGANVNRKTCDKMTPLHYAAARGLTDIVILLLNSGAHVDSLDSSEKTPLYTAVSRGQLETTKILIQYGARVNIEEIHFYTPLCEGVWQKNVEIVELLLSAGAKITHAHNLLHYAILHRHTDMVALLLRAGPNNNKRDSTGDTPLIIAARTGQVRIAEMLLKHGAAANFSNGITGSTPLHEAIENIRECDFSTLESMFKLLVRFGAKMDNVTWSSGDTPLNRALLMMAYQAAALLIRHGADPNKCDKRANFLTCTSLYDNLGLARRRKKFGIIQMLVYAGYDLQHKTPDIPYPEDWSSIDLDTIDGWLTYQKYNPMSLKHLTRLNIRKWFGPDISTFVNKAHLPSSIRQYLMLHDIDITSDEKT